MLTRYNSEYHGGGVAVLKRLPGPSSDELINIALTSVDVYVITAASLELLERVKHMDEDFRTALLQRLLEIDCTNLPAFERQRLKIIIFESRLNDPTNRRDIVGKQLAAIQHDADYFRSIAEAAQKILACIDL